MDTDSVGREDLAGVAKLDPRNSWTTIAALLRDAPMQRIANELMVWYRFYQVDHARNASSFSLTQSGCS